MSSTVSLIAPRPRHHQLIFSYYTKKHKTLLFSTIKRNVSTEIMKPRSFALSGCGWLTPFHLGVMFTMKQHGYLTQESIIGGTSGGSLGAAIACSGKCPKESLEFLIQASQNRLFRKNIHIGLKESLRQFFPSDILEKCNGRLHVCVTKVWPQPRNKVTIINNFETVDELLEVIAASCFIPLYSAPLSIYAKIGSEYYIDGGVFAFIPPIGDIRVSPIPIPSFRQSRRSHIHIISRKFSIAQLITWVLIPPSPSILRELFQEGAKSAEFWIRKEATKKQLSVYIEPPIQL